MAEPVNLKDASELVDTLRDSVTWCHCHDMYPNEPLNRPFFRHTSCANTLLAATTIAELVDELHQLRQQRDTLINATTHLSAEVGRLERTVYDR